MIADERGRDDAARPPVFVPGQIVSERYRILRFINRGGMGEVYEADDLELHERVALKTLLPEIASDARSIAHFKQEIQLSRKVSHPNVCKVFDLTLHTGNDPGSTVVYFLTMELLPGETMEAHLRREGPMSMDQALPLLTQVAAALDAAHQAGIIHRDLKPSNIMLLAGTARRQAVVTDFGLAHSNAPPDPDAATHTVTTGIRGTPGYMAPELLAGETASVSSDVYALGMTAYRMVAGDLPAKSAVMAGLDPKWRQAIERALDRDPANRFSNAGEFVDCIRGTSPVTVPAIQIHNKRPLFAGAGLIVALLAVWIGWRAWDRWHAQPSAEAMQFFRMGTDDLHAASYFAATKALAQAARLAPHYSLAHARLAEAWMELELPEKATVEMLIARREGTTALSSSDRMQIDAIDRSITREFAGAADKYREMLKSAGADRADIYVDLGRTLEKSEQKAEAIENYSLAAKANPRHAAAWLRLAVLHSQALQSAQAQEEFHKAEELYQIASNFEGLTEVLYERSVDANWRERLEENAKYARQMLETAHTIGNVHQEIRAKLQLGSNAIFSGDNALAEKYAGEALETARTNHIESLAIRGILLLGNGYRAKRDLANAEKYGRDALALARRNESGRLVAVSLLFLGSVHDLQGRSEDVDHDAQEALAFFEPHHYARETLLCLALHGRAQRNRGDPGAMDSFRHALEMAETLGDSRQMSLAHASMGSLLGEQERLPEALVHHQKSLELSTNPQQIGYAALECAEALWPLGRYNEAAVMFLKAEANAAKFPALRLSIAGSRAEMLASQRKFSEAVTLCTRTLAASPEPAVTFRLTRILGSAQIGLGKKREGSVNCEKALSMAEKLGDVSSSLSAQLTAAEARIAVGDIAEALTLLRKIELSVTKLPLSRWYLLALSARADPRNSRNYALAAKQQLDDIERQWGKPTFQMYISRPDLRGSVELVSRFSRTNRQ
jgi:tetratricopeptide (TPR) repeat protein